AKGKGTCWGFEAEVVGRVWRVVEWQESVDEWVKVKQEKEKNKTKLDKSGKRRKA
nr:hypothetical protein [Tanacetum cinerariifolium]